MAEADVAKQTQQVATLRNSEANLSKKITLAHADLEKSLAANNSLQNQNDDLQAQVNELLSKEQVLKEKVSQQNSDDILKALLLKQTEGTPQPKAATLSIINKTTSTDTSVPTFVITGTANKDKVTLANKYQFLVDGQPFTSN